MDKNFDIRSSYQHNERCLCSEIDNINSYLYITNNLCFYKTVNLINKNHNNYFYFLIKNNKILEIGLKDNISTKFDFDFNKIVLFNIDSNDSKIISIFILNYLFQKYNLNISKKLKFDIYKNDILKLLKFNFDVLKSYLNTIEKYINFYFFELDNNVEIKNVDEYFKKTINYFFEITPFVKWVGGKRNVIKKYLCHYLPKNFNTYFEPFVGGGAMLFYLKPEKAIINDINSELMTTYNVIKEECNTFLKMMDEYKNKIDNENFLKIRKEKPVSDLEIASRFLYLNKTSFNGLYRVNSKGEFNVPFNGSSKTTFYDEKNILLISQYFSLNEILVYNDDFNKVINLAKKNDFIFCDPPYDYEIGEKGFDAYNKDSFGQNGQIKLADALKKAHEKGVKWMLTNHDTKLINSLYSEFKIIKMTTNRSINSKGDLRKNAGKEVMIINYEI